MFLSTYKGSLTDFYIHYFGQVMQVFLSDKGFLHFLHLQPIIQTADNMRHIVNHHEHLNLTTPVFDNHYVCVVFDALKSCFIRLPSSINPHKNPLDTQIQG
jgi:hypothetical protein